MKKKVVRFDFWLNPAFDQHMSALKDIEVSVSQYSDDEQKTLALFKEAHVYHICAARDEVPSQWWVDEALLSKMPHLLCASTSGAGYDPVDVEACNRHGVLVVNQSGCNANSVAEHALGMLLSVKHRITESDRVMRANAYTTREDLMGHDIRGSTIGIVGVGNIGTRMAELAKAFDMTVLGYDPYLSNEEIKRRGATPVTFEELLARSDVVTVHCPRNPETLNWIGAKEFRAMKKGAVFIATARGGIHDEQALYEALRDNHLSGAGLDVWSVEPPATDNPLLSLPNVVATYHTAGVKHEARGNAAAMGAAQIEVILRGERPPRLVNPEVFPVFLERYKKMFG
jgi:D-3-phosphoglycerate dehydrogenase